MCSSVFGFNCGIFRSYKSFLFEIFNLFLDCIITHIHCFTDGGIARIALVRFSVLAVHKIRVYEYLTCCKSKIKNTFWYWKICALYISFVVIVFQYYLLIFEIFDVQKSEGSA